MPTRSTLVDHPRERQRPLDATSSVARAMTLYERGRVIEARNMLMRAHSIGARGDDLLVKLGWCCAATNMHREAVQWMASAVDAAPDSVDARFGLATALSNIGRPGEARKQLEAALVLQPRHYQSLIQLGELKTASKDSAEAESLFRRAIASEPTNPVGWLTLSTALNLQGRWDEATEAVEMAQRLARETGNDLENFVNLAIVRGDAGQFDEARKILESNLNEKPSPAAHLAYAFLLLRSGAFNEGWDHYEFRLMQPNHIADRPHLGKPPWVGQALQGKTILLRREQGFGDAFQFVRYAPALQALGATVWVQIQTGLRELAGGFDGVHRVFGDDEPLPEFDYYVHLASLPRLFGTTLATIPSNVPYVHIGDEHVAKWRHRLGGASGFKVGLVWAGHPNHVRDRERSIALGTLRPLAAIEGVALFSLQKGAANAEIASTGLRIEDLAAELSNFSDTAAAIQCLDLVITVDTAVAHLAGAMGKPAWVLLPKVAEFRWLESREDSPWYPAMRLVRQERRGDWDEVARRVAGELGQRVLERSNSALAWRELTPAIRGGRAEVARNPQLDSGAYSQVAETRVGLVHYLPYDIPIADSIRSYGEYLQPMIDETLRLLPLEATIVEAGAGVGIHALALARAVGPSSHLILYEDRALHRRLLYQNVAANQVSNVTIMRQSIGPSPTEVTAETVDELELERLDLLKINSPASILEVIGGAAGTLWRLRPLLVGTGFGAANMDSVVQRMQDFGYRCWLRDFALFDPENFYRRDQDVSSGRIETAVVCIAEERDIDLRSRGFRDV